MPCGYFHKIVGFPPESSILIGFSIIFTIHFGVFPYFWKHPCRSIYIPASSHGMVNVREDVVITSHPWDPKSHQFPHWKPWFSPIHPGRLTAGTCPHGGLVQIIFLSKWVTWRFHILIFQGVNVTERSLRWWWAVQPTHFCKKNICSSQIPISFEAS